MENYRNLYFNYHQIPTLSDSLVCEYMNRVMRKPVYAICKQQRRRSAYTSMQSDQHLHCRCLDSTIPLLAIAEISRPWLVSEAEQAGLSLIW